MPTIYDNIDKKLIDTLNDRIKESKRVDFCVGYFNLRGWKQISNSIDLLVGDTVEENNVKANRACRLLVGMQKLPIDILKESFFKDEDYIIDQSEVNKLKKRLAQEFREQLTIGTPSEDDEKALRKLSTQLKGKKVNVKLHLSYPLHAKLYLLYDIHETIPVIGFLGSSNLTLAGLSKQGELNIDVLEYDSATKLVKWFEDRWKDRWCIDITDELIEIIDSSWASEKLTPPYHIYLKIAYHLSREARAGLSEFRLSNVFKTELLEFQQKAVLVAAHHLHKRNGVMIGDVVGLGKTITAIALAKIFEEDFFLETLIICPKNLVEMWEDYAHKYQLRAKVISQSRVQSLLPDLRRYRLVIIDESHNLRNDQGSRYRAIKAYLEENESKVILLSATPYNKSFVDLSNQLRLFLSDDKDLGITPERYIESIGGQVHFIAKHTETFIRSIKAFEKSEFSDDWRELMRLYLVRRTRSFIKENYAVTDQENNRKYLTFADGSRSYFPERIAKRVDYHFDPDDINDQYAKLYSEEVVDIINELDLPRYGLGNYIQKKLNKGFKPLEKEEKIISNLSRAGKRLMGFCRTNLFKRLESSGYAFLLSLSRHILRNYIFIYAMENNLPIPIGQPISNLLDGYIEDNDIDNENNNDNEFKIIINQNDYLKKAEKVYKSFTDSSLKSNFDWIRCEFFTETLKKHLLEDSKNIIKILEKAQTWKAENDRKLKALFNLVNETHKTKKILVFTQYADTALYIYEYLKNNGVSKIEYVTGDTESPTNIAQRFSPISNKKTFISNEEVRILITTDVLSEGQNLQDSHIILNYDLPWAIIRLIQRAGRVDRIGQKSEQILCYSFLPEDGVEKIINLRGRLKTRIKQNAEVIGADETFFDGDPINLYDLYNEKSGILEDADNDTEVDLSSYAFQIWKNATDANPSLKNIIPDLPNVIYSTKNNPYEKDKQGVILYARTADDNDVLTWIDSNNRIITQSQLAILKALQCGIDEPPLPKIENHHEIVKKGFDYIREEEKSIGGSLGKKTGVKYRVYMRLDRYCSEKKDTFFVTEELKKAIDEIYKYPFKEFARETLNRQLKVGISDEELIDLVVSLRDEDKLCIVNEDDSFFKEPQIICSMGLNNKIS